MIRDPKIHLFSLLPGERFRLGDDDASPAYSVVEGVGDRTAFLDADGRPASSRAIAAINGGSLFVHPIPEAEGGLK